MMKAGDGRQMTEGERQNAQVDAGEVREVTQDLIESLTGWRDELTDTLEQMSTDAYQRLILQLLEKDGVGQIELSSANDTIEGIGIFGGGGFLTFRVSFRCIRGGGRISSAEVDDFRRGVMVGGLTKGCSSQRAASRRKRS